MPNYIIDQERERYRNKLAQEMAHTYQGGANELSPFAEYMQNIVRPAINERVTGISANALRLLGKGDSGTNAVASDYMNNIGQEVDRGTRNFAKNAALSLYGETPEIRRNAIMEGYGALPFGTESLSGPMGAFAGMIAYHGSPHKFDKFKMDKIGTGEGAQAYGHGLYFAENPAVARSYKGDSIGDAPVPWFFKYKGVDVPAGGPEQKGADLIHSMGLKQAQKFARDTLKEVESGAEWAKDTDPSYWRGVSDFTNKVLSKREITKQQGNLYKVDISDDAVKNFLDWDKPLSQQPESVRKALSNSILAVKDATKEQVNVNGVWYDRKLFENGNSLSIGEVPSIKGESAYSMLNKSLGDNVKTSDYLKSIGIPGIRYLDQGSRDTTQRWIAKHPRGGENSFNTQEALEAFIKRNPEYKAIEPKTTSNFVVFDEDIVKILNKE